MKIHGPFSRRKNVIYSEVGSPEYTECVLRFSPDGNMYLEEGKVRNRQAEINSYRDSCDVNLMIRRYENGDQTALLRDNTGAFADFSTLPKNIHEAERLRKNVSFLYDQIGDDVKLKYGTLDDFLCAFSTKSNFDEFVTYSQECARKRSDKFRSNSNSDKKE